MFRLRSTRPPVGGQLASLLSSETLCDGRERARAARRWVAQWRITELLLDEITTQDLRAMTEKEGRRIAEMAMEAVPNPKNWSPDPLSSGMVEQQRWFMKMPQK